MKKLLFLLLALVWLPACQAAPKLYWSEDGTNGYWGALQGTVGGFTDGATVTAVGITSNTAAAVAFVPSWSTNSMTVTISNTAAARAAAYVGYQINIGTNGAAVGFIVSNQVTGIANTYTINGVSTGIVIGTLRVPMSPNGNLTWSNVYTLVNTSYVSTVQGAIE
jgi:hypothetical protein